MYNIQWGDTSYPRSFQRFDLGVSFQRFVYILRTHILLTFLGHTETYNISGRALSKRPEKLWLGTPWTLISTLSCKWRATVSSCAECFILKIITVWNYSFLLLRICLTFTVIFICCCTMINLFVSFVTNSSLIKKW